MASSGGQIFYRRSTNLVMYWVGEGLFIQNYATRTQVTATPAVCEMLHAFADWRPIDTIFSAMPRYTHASIRRLVSRLVASNLIQRSDQPQRSAERSMENWSAWNPAAGFFHSSTKDVPYSLDPVAGEKLLRRRARRHPMPSPVKRYPGRRVTSLPKIWLRGEFPQVLFERRTWREFAGKPIERRDLAALLHLTWGIQRWGIVRGQGRVALKTSPSGGARHPGEVYVLAIRVRGLSPGLYHYRADVHALELLKRGASARHVEVYLPGQRWYRRAAALMLMTAVFEREQWRYPFSRAYRAVLLDAGHLCQTFCLAATWLGLAPFCTMGLADSRIDADLGLDGISESILYVAGVGVRPVHGWRPGIVALEQYHGR